MLYSTRKSANGTKLCARYETMLLILCAFLLDPVCYYFGPRSIVLICLQTQLFKSNMSAVVRSQNQLRTGRSTQGHGVVVVPVSPQSEEIVISCHAEIASNSRDSHARNDLNCATKRIGTRRQCMIKTFSQRKADSLLSALESLQNGP